MAIYLPLIVAVSAFLVIQLLLRLPPERGAALVIGSVPLVVAGSGVLLTLFGRGVIGVPLTLVGLSWWRRRGSGGPRSTPSGAGRTSTVRTGLVEMELDHDTGEMDGRILSGVHAGARLSDLTEPDLVALYRSCLNTDRDSASLLETYLDRRFADWRNRAGANRDSAAGHTEMTREEAYQVLGLEPGATREEIQLAWRRLMKKVHPDSGGSAALAARLNAAKDLLLG